MNSAMRSAADITTVCIIYCYYWCDFSSYVLSSLLVWLCQHDAVTVLFLLSLLPVIPHFLFNALLLLLALLRYPHRSNSDMSILIPWSAFVKRFTMPPVIPPPASFSILFSLKWMGGHFGLLRKPSLHFKNIHVHARATSLCWWRNEVPLNGAIQTYYFSPVGTLKLVCVHISAHALPFTHRQKRFEKRCQSEARY